MENNKYNWRPYRSEEFHEEDVWGLNVMKESETRFKIRESNGSAAPISISRRLPSAARMIPVAQKPQHHHDNHDENYDGEHHKVKVVQHSAPVNLPDWSKIYGKISSSPRRKNIGTCSSSSPHGHDLLHDGAAESDEDDYGGHDDDDDDGDGDSDGDDGRLPPHEWLAKKLARSQISSFSVCEGVGRTLKGRDLSRVRNAVLSKTGFI